MGNRLEEKEVLLSTAIVKVDSSKGQSVLCRLLVDHGSQVSFITQGCFQRLSLQRKVAGKGLTVNGIGGVTKGTLADYVYCDIRPWFDSSFSVTVKMYLLDKITDGEVPSCTVKTEWSELTGLKLVDPSFNQVGQIDMLLGADVYSSLLYDQVNTLRSPDRQLIAQQTVLGWLVSGPAN